MDLISLVHSVSPSLAAYHYLRLRKAQIDSGSIPFSRNRCSKCGYLLLHGTSNTRLVRFYTTRTNKKRIPSTPRSPIVHSVQQTCTTCGYVNNTLLQPVNHNFLFHPRNLLTSPQSSSRPSRPVPQQVTPHTPGTDQLALPDPTPASTDLHPPLHSSPSLPPLANAQPQPRTKPRKSRPKHKTGLQEILARNRERQRDAADRGSAGLSTFLHSL